MNSAKLNFRFTEFSEVQLALLAHPAGLLLYRRFPTHPERLKHRSNTPNEHDDRQDKR
jgi:hypothetical protein